MRFTVLALTAALVAAPLGAADPATFPSWMAGAWVSAEGDRWTEEFWTHPRDEMMIGASRAGQGDRLRNWEAIRIVLRADGTLAYVPMPNGGAPVEFALVRQDARSIEFANPAHDFPPAHSLLARGRQAARRDRPARWQPRGGLELRADRALTGAVLPAAPFTVRGNAALGSRFKRMLALPRHSSGKTGRTLFHPHRGVQCRAGRIHISAGSTAARTCGPASRASAAPASR